jgi:signal transduction histidine kinase
METASVPRERWPIGATAGALVVAAACEAAHGLAYQGRVVAGAVAHGVALALVELIALTWAHRALVRRGWAGPACFGACGALAVAVGVAMAFAYFTRSEARPLVVLQLGAFDGLFAVGLWAVAIFGPRAVRDAHARDLEAKQLRAAAELARLRASLQPHFLLNTLTTIAGLVVEDPRGARELLGALGALLRDSLEDAEEMQTLDGEVAWLRRYAEILEVRHRGALRFAWEIAPETRALRVPRQLLQPLVENAVKHGALRRREGGEVAVRAQLDAGGDVLRCVVEDNGPGPIAREGRPGAMGIALVQRRLALKYAGAASFRLESDGGRTRCIVDLPARGAS